MQINWTYLDAYVPLRREGVVLKVTSDFYLL
jgi:hypothetical protein